jgi:hypothetical protein
MSRKTKRAAWIIWYCLWYPFIRTTIVVDYIPRRIFNGWGVVFQETGLLAGAMLSMAILGTIFTGVPILILWYLGRRTFFTHYRPKVEALKADFYATS